MAESVTGLAPLAAVMHAYVGNDGRLACGLPSSVETWFVLRGLDQVTCRDCLSALPPVDHSPEEVEAWLSR